MESTLSFQSELTLSEAEARFDIAPGAVRAWIAALPLAHIGHTSQRLYGALNELNRRRLSPRQRAEVLQALELPLLDLLQGVRPYYLLQPFPLGEKNHKVAELATALHRHTAIGYQLIHQELRETGWLAQQVNRRLQVLAVAGILRHAEGILLVYRSLGLEAPKGLWSLIHTTYLDAVRLNIHGERPEASGLLSRNTPTLTTLYSRLVLLTQLQMQQLRPEQFKGLYAELDTWAAALRLRDLRGAPGKVEFTRFVINLDGDAPPQLLGLVGPGRVSGEQALMVDTEQLRGLLRQVSTQADGQVHHSPEVLKLLFRGWCEPPRNIERRHSTEMSIEVFFGFSNLHRMLYIHEMLWGHLPGDRGDVERILDESGLGVRSSFKDNSRGIVVEELDPWSAAKKPETYFSMRDQEQQDKDFRHRTAHILDLNVVGCKVLNLSDHGYRISAPSARIGSVQPGELVAIRDNRHKGWRIGSVRWASMADREHLILGLQVHFEQSLPLLFRSRNDGHTSEAMPCLLAFYREWPVLVLPHITRLTQKEILLEYAKQEVKVQLQPERLLGSASFEVYNFTAGSVQARTPYPDVELEQLAPMLITNLEQEIDPNDESSKFDEIFSQLR